MQIADTLTVQPGSQPPWWANLLQQGLTVFQAERLRAENLRRIREGLPLLTEQQARALAPTANVKVELPQGVKLALIGGGIALLALLFTRR